MLFRKMLRDMKLNLTQFVSIFLMAMLGVLVYAGINSEWYGMQKESDRYYKETNLADLWVVGDNFTEENEAAAKKVSGVASVQRRLVLEGTADLAGDPVVRMNIVDDNLISRPQILKGLEFDPKADGIWLDNSFAEAHALKVGDSITLKAMGMEIAKEVKGLVIHPEYVYNVSDSSEFMPDAKAYGFAFIPRSALSFAGRLPYNQLLIKTGEENRAPEVQELLEDSLSGSYDMMISRGTHPSVSMFDMEIKQNKALGGLFPIVFFLIATLSMLTTMTRMTNGQRTQIGTLKALGFSKRKILFHYISYGIWLGLAGGLAGLILGPMIVPSIMFTMQKEIYTLPQWYGAISFTDAFAVLLAMLSCGVSSYVACRKELRDVPASTLRPRAPKTGRLTQFEKSALWYRFGFPTQWNLRDIMRNKIRSIMAVIGVMGCMALILWGLGLRDTVNSVSHRLYGKIYTYESKINFEENISKDDVNLLKKNFPGQLIQEANIEIKNGNGKKSGTLTVTGPGNLLNLPDPEMDRLNLPGSGAAISFKMAEALGIKAGDKVQWRIYGEKSWQTSEVSSIFRIPLGQGIAMSETAYKNAGNTMSPTALLASKDADGAEKYSGVKSVQKKAQLIDSFNSLQESMQMVIAVLILAAVVLGAVVLYNLGALSLTERLRELATLKVLGFANKKIQSLLQRQNIWLTILGILLGIPAGFLFIKLMLKTMPESSDFVSSVAVPTLIICTAVTFILSVLVNIVMSGKVKSIDMVSSLKSVE